MLHLPVRRRYVVRFNLRWVLIMIQISKVVLEIVEKSPFLADVLSEGIANISQVARRIKPQVEKRLYEEVSVSAIAMALRRLDLKRKRAPSGVKFLKELSDITVRSSLVEIACTNDPRFMSAYREVLQFPKADGDIFCTFSQGLRESIFIVSSTIAPTLIKKLPKGSVIKTMEGLSAVTLRLPEESLNVPGVYYPVLKALAWEGINFIEIVSVDRELSIIFEDKDVDRAFSVIKRLTS